VSVALVYSVAVSRLWRNYSWPM